MYLLTVVWSTGEKSTSLYQHKEAAEQAANNMRMAFGEQIVYAGYQKVLAWQTNPDGTITPTMYGM